MRTLLYRILLVGILSPCLSFAENPVGPVPPGIKAVRETDGVWRFDRQVSTSTPAFWQQLRDLFKLKPVTGASFGRSVAFLTGVAYYDHQSPQLPFVDSDLTELRNFLLTQGGFDTVFEARGPVVRRSLIEDYLINKFSVESDLLGKNDRLLFYYTGHGADKNGRIGFLEFSHSTPGYFAGDDVLEVDQFQRWSPVIVAKHLLVILDACASGLATAAKAGESPADRRQMELNALSGEGSGFMMTAGTGAQKAYQLRISNEKGYSVFTHALLTALRQGQDDDAFMTINEVFGKAQKSVAAFNVDEGKSMDPRIWPVNRQDGEAAGTFVFVNVNAKSPPPPPVSSGIVAVKGDEGENKEAPSVQTERPVRDAVAPQPSKIVRQSPLIEPSRSTEVPPKPDSFQEALRRFFAEGRSGFSAIGGRGSFSADDGGNWKTWVPSVNLPDATCKGIGPTVNCTMFATKSKSEIKRRFTALKQEVIAATAGQDWETTVDVALDLQRANQNGISIQSMIVTPTSGGYAIDLIVRDDRAIAELHAARAKQR